MIPLRDDNPTLAMSIATMALILVNIIFWVFLQHAGGEPFLSFSICEYGLIPGELSGAVPPGTRVDLGGDAACVLGPTSWLTVLSSMFMHGGWFHIIGNMWFLWIFGNNVEDIMGRARYVAFYLLCGLAAALTQVYTNTHSALPMVGASGAIGGVMGAYAVSYPRARVETLIIFGFYVRVVSVPAFWMLGYWFVLQLLGGLPALAGDDGGGIAFWAHVGGFVAGVVLLFVFRNPQLLAAHRALTQTRESSQQLAS
jgi:membrane associated rhomboid family serine protease